MSDFEVFQKSFFTVQVRDDMYNVRDYAMILYYLMSQVQIYTYIYKHMYIHINAYNIYVVMYICMHYALYYDNYIDIWRCPGALDTSTSSFGAAAL